MPFGGLVWIPAMRQSSNSTFHQTNEKHFLVRTTENAAQLGTGALYVYYICVFLHILNFENKSYYQYLMHR